MADFPEITAPPPPRKSTPWKIIIPIVIVVLLCCLCLVVVGVLVYLGTQGTGPFASLQNNNPLTTITDQSMIGDWDLYYTWDCSNSSYNGPVTISFYTDGTFYAVEDSSGGYGTWTLRSSALDYIYNEEPRAHYIGTLISTRDYVEGAMSTSDGSVGCFNARKR